VGLHAGPVVFQDGDYFGRTVNLAARIAAQAGPGQVLVSDQVVAECGDGPVAFEPIGAVPLKGVADPVPLHRATRPG
jgi:adenylate cyclase